MYAKSATTISNILEAAQSLFLVKNYTDVSMAEIAAAAQVTKGALYHHFSSKQELYLKMMHDYLAEQQRLFRAAVESGGNCRARLRHLTLSFLELPPGKRNLMKLVRRDINVFKDPQRGQLVRAYQAALPEQVEAILRDGLRDGELKPTDARLLAWEFVALVEVALAPYAQRVLGSADRVADFVLGLFFDGAAGRGEWSARMTT